MGQIESMVDDFLAREDRPREWFANQMGVNSKTLSSWFRRGRKSPPPPPAIKAMARVLKVPYRTVLDAALADGGYLPESRVADLEPLPSRRQSSFSARVEAEVRGEPRRPKQSPEPAPKRPESEVG